MGADELSLQWLGTACFELRTARASVLIDPYFSREGWWGFLTHPLESDRKLIEQYVRPVDAVAVGHGHADHLLDAPTIAKRLGVPLYASADALKVAGAEGLSVGQTRMIQPGDRFGVGDLEIEVVRSAHSEMFTQCLVGGDMPDRVQVPMRFHGYKNGPVLGFWIRWRGRAIFHCGSAQLVEASLPRGVPDVLLFCISGWRADPRIFERIAQALGPEVIVPMHHDDFFQPLSRPLKLGPAARFGEAIARIRLAMPRTRIAELAFFESLRLEART